MIALEHTVPFALVVYDSPAILQYYEKLICHISSHGKLRPTSNEKSHVKIACKTASLKMHLDEAGADTEANQATFKLYENLLS